MEKTVAKTQHDEAFLLHAEIMQRGALAAGALADFCDSLKRMRDSRLYLELGCADFDTYCETWAGIKARMAYNYIASYERLGDEYVREHAMLGITKLEVLSRMTPEDRTEAESVAPSMSASELKDLRDKLSVAGRQIELLTEDLEAEKTKNSDMITELDALQKENQDALENAEKRITELQKRIDAAVEISEEAKREIRVSAEKELRDGIEKSATESAEKKVLEKLEKAKKEAKEAKDKEKRLLDEKKTCEEEILRLKRKLAASDAAVSAVKVYFNEVQDSFNKMTEKMMQCDDDVRAKLLAAAGKLLEACRERLQETARGDGK